jgi:hypothetical protein
MSGVGDKRPTRNARFQVQCSREAVHLVSGLALYQTYIRVSAPPGERSCPLSPRPFTPRASGGAGSTFPRTGMPKQRDA